MKHNRSKCMDCILRNMHYSVLGQSHNLQSAKKTGDDADMCD